MANGSLIKNGEKTPWYVDVAVRFGLPTFLLVVVLVGVYLLGTQIVKTVVVPYMEKQSASLEKRDEQIDLALDTFTEAVKEVTDNINDNTVNQVEQVRQLSNINEALRKQAEDLKGASERNGTKLDEIKQILKGDR